VIVGALLGVRSRVARTLAGIAGALIVFLALARPAIGDTPVPAAQDVAGYKEHFDAAKKLVASKSFDAAAAEFEAAYAATPNPDALRQELDCYKELHASAKETTIAKRLLEQPKTLKTTEKKTLEALIASLGPAVGTVVLSSSEAGGAVKVDGKEMGSTPIARPLDLDAGPHKLSVSKGGFESFEQDVAIAGQATVTVDVVMEPEIFTGKVTVSEAAGAFIDVLLDGRVVGSTPWAGEISLGEHQIAGRSPILEAPVQTVEVLKRKPLEVALIAVPRLGTIEITVMGGAGVVYVDGKVAGEGGAKMDVPVGRHAVSVRRDGFNTVERDVDVTAGEVSVVKIALEPRVPTPTPAPHDVYQGVYGGLSFAGLFQANSTGNQLERRCSDVANSCSANAEKGGGLYGFVGYTWRPIGVDLFFGGSGDGSSPSAGPPVDQSWSIIRISGLGALRVRSRLETRRVRASLAIGLGVAENYLFSLGLSKPNFASSNYASLLGTFDVAVALRWLASSAVAIGCMGFLENAGQSAFVDVPSSRTPFWLFSGPQFLIEPYLGVQFGP
jgi:hypothetical protein